MSKAFTALSILKLRDEGKLSLDAPAETYVPELKGWRYPTADAPKIRVRDLLNHTAGLVTDDPWGDRQTPLGEELLHLRDAFLSQLAYQTYSGYVLSQFRKLESDLRRTGAPKWKHVMHLLRLLLSARELLEHGRLMVDVGPHRDRLLAVRRGELAWEQVEQWRLELHRQIDDAVVRSPLPAGRLPVWRVTARTLRSRSPACARAGGGSTSCTAA
jgi:hypothetical protein